MNKISFFKKIAAATAGLRRESGSIAVETALGITFLVSTAVILSDMHQIGIERERLEAGAGSIAVNAAQQPKLTQYGLDALVDASLQTETRDTEVIIMNVLQSGAVQWMIRRATGRCSANSMSRGSTSRANCRWIRRKIPAKAMTRAMWTAARCR